MMFSLAIVLVVLAYTWVWGPVAPRWVRHVPTVVVIGVTVWRALKTGEWGLARSEFLPALRWAVVLTGLGGVAMSLAGVYLGTWHDRRDLLGNLAVLLPWAVGQQLALQTVLLREAQAGVSKAGGVWIAALVFGALP